MIVDESTDRGKIHSLAILTRYVDFELGCINDSVFDLIEIYQHEFDIADADNLFAKMMQSFLDAGIPINHII